MRDNELALDAELAVDGNIAAQGDGHALGDAGTVVVADVGLAVPDDGGSSFRSVKPATLLRWLFSTAMTLASGRKTRAPMLLREPFR